MEKEINSKFFDTLIEMNKEELISSMFPELNNEEIKEMFRVHEDYPTMDELFEEFVKPKMKLIDGTSV